MDFDKRTVRTLSMLGTCGAYGMALCELAERSEDIVAITADLKYYSGLERFAEAFPERFFNVGIAEQDLVGVAAGMASEGLRPFASTYATFASMRCADQVRVSMGYMGLPVKLVGLTAGFSAGILGPTHMSIEDVAVMRAVPNMVVISPADGVETVKAVRAAAGIDAPVYLRLGGVMGCPVVYDRDYSFEIGRAVKLRDGEDVLAVATGPAVANTLAAARFLETRGITCEVLDIHTVRPLDVEAVRRAAQGKRAIVAVEEHSVVGGLGSAICEAFARIPCPPIDIIGCSDAYPHANNYENLVTQSGLSPQGIAERILKMVGGKSVV